MRNPVQRLRERLYRMEETAVRVHQMHSTLADVAAELLNERDEWRREVRAEAERASTTQSVVSETRLLANNIQELAGGALSSANVVRSAGLHQIDLLRMALGRIEARQLRLGECRDWRANEFKVYSQFGEDGLVQFLLREVQIADRYFVEFGVEDYQESNTRFLLLNDRWSGLVLDGSEDHVAAIRGDLAFTRYDLQARAAFITRENIDEVLIESNVPRTIGLLSIDIDGNDYWVWEAITAVEAVIVIVEYNYRFGPSAAVVTPYRPDFVKDDAHPSGIYYGASLAALCRLANRKGYAFVGCSGGGVNAFFVKRSHLPETLPERSPEEGFVCGQHMEMRDSQGVIRKASLEEQRDLLLTLPLISIGEDFV